MIRTWVLRINASAHPQAPPPPPPPPLFFSASIYSSSSKLKISAMSQPRAVRIAIVGDVKMYKSKPQPQKHPAPAIAYFHIPLPEFSSFDASNFTGVKQEGISSPSVNSGFFTTMVEAGDVKTVFTGHDHLNDFCGELTGIHLCYAGEFGYHAYGKAGWSRRARVVLIGVSGEESRW